MCAQELLALCDVDTAVEINSLPIAFENNENNNDLEGDNPLQKECTSSDEFCTIHNIYSEEQGILNLAPCENKNPEAFYHDVYCEEMAFPFLLPKGKFGYKVCRPIKLSPVKYFNQRLLNYTQRFSSCGDYIFFAHYIIQQMNLHNQMNIASSKVSGDINVGQLKNNLSETVRSFVCEDKGLMFMKSIKGTPVYWKTFLYDVLAMVKQLGLPTFFLTLSCADLRWKELMQIISRLNKIDFENENDMGYFDRCNILNQNPVLTARHSISR